MVSRAPSDLLHFLWKGEVKSSAHTNPKKKTKPKQKKHFTHVTYRTINANNALCVNNIKSGSNTPSPTVQTHDTKVHAPAESEQAIARALCVMRARGKVENSSSLHVSLFALPSSSHCTKQSLNCRRGLVQCCLPLSGRSRPAPVAACAGAAPLLDIGSRS